VEFAAQSWSAFPLSVGIRETGGSSVEEQAKRKHQKADPWHGQDLA
jgi:hypothetical protein